MLPGLPRPNAKAAFNRPAPQGTGYNTPALTRPKAAKPRQSFGEEIMGQLDLPDSPPAITMAPARTSPTRRPASMIDRPPLPASDPMADAISHRQRMGIADQMIGGNERFGQFAGGMTAFAYGDLPDSAPVPTRKPFNESMAQRRDATTATLDSDPAAIASRQRSQQTFAPVADRNLVMQGALPAVARRTDLTPEQQTSFANRRNERNAEMELRKQRQFSRAQYRGAAAGNSPIFDDDGSIDLMSSLATNIAARSTPTEFERDPRTGAIVWTNDNARIAMDSLLGEQTNQVKQNALDAKERIDTFEALIDAAQRQADRDQQIAAFDEDARQFGLQYALNQRQLDADNATKRRQHRLDRRKLQAQDLNQQRELGIKELEAQEAREQGKFNRSPEPHRRKIDEKKTMPHSLHKSPYLQ